MCVVSITEPGGFASTRWNDYVGTVAADDAAVLPGGPSLYELTGLDRSHWIVVGVDLKVRAKVPELVILAAARGPKAANLDDLVDANEQLPVTAFSITEPDQVQRFFTEAFGQLSISLRPRDLGYPVRVVEQGMAHEISPG